MWKCSMHVVRTAPAHQTDNTRVTLGETITGVVRKARPCLIREQIFCLVSVPDLGTRFGCPLNRPRRWSLSLHIVRGYMSGVWASLWKNFMGPPESPTTSTRKWLWQIGDGFLIPFAHPCLHCAALRVSVVCVAFQGVGQEGRTALYLLRCPQHRQAGFRACEICKEDFFLQDTKIFAIVCTQETLHTCSAS